MVGAGVPWAAGMFLLGLRGMVVVGAADSLQGPFAVKLRRKRFRRSIADRCFDAGRLSLEAPLPAPVAAPLRATP